MKTALVLCCFMLMGVCRYDVVAAPHPQYYCGYAVVPFPCHGCDALFFASNYGQRSDTVGVRQQFIYKPRFYPGPKNGQITAVYFRSGGTYPNGSVTVYPYYEVRLGHTSQAAYRPLGSASAIDTFLETVEVFSDSNYTMQGSDSGYGWVMIPLTTPFTYDTSMNLVVEIRSGPPSPQYAMRYFTSGQADTGYCVFISGFTNSPYSIKGSGNPRLYDFGFDVLASNEAEAILPKANVLLYPNPAGETLHLSGAAGGMEYQILDLAGRRMRSGRVPPECQIDIRELTQGSYL
jgi:hypothetical protein